MNIYIYTYIHIYIYTYIHIYIYTYIHIYIYTYIHIYIYTYIHIYTYIYIYMYTHIYVYTYIYIEHIHTCIHTCIHIYIYMYVFIQLHKLYIILLRMPQHVLMKLRQVLDAEHHSLLFDSGNAVIELEPTAKSPSFVKEKAPALNCNASVAKGVALSQSIEAAMRKPTIPAKWPEMV